MNLLLNLSDELLFKLEEIKTILFPYTKRAYIVGGSVRDLFLNISPKDLDIEVYDIKPNDFENLMTNLGAVEVGKSFLVYKYKNIDLSLPRRENKTSTGHRGFSVAYCNNEKEASSRRDFTINSMMINIFDEKFIDYHGGQKDLEYHTLRFVNEATFLEDPLRVYRGVRFASRFCFLIEEKTQKSMMKMEVGELSSTRVFWELEKIFNSSYPEVGVFYLYKLKLLKKLFNEEYDDKIIYKIIYKINKNKKNVNIEIRPYYVLYFLLNELKCDIKSSLIKLNATKVFFNMLVDIPYFEEKISDFDLFKIAIDMPLKYWAGICQNNAKNKAIEFNIYENKFTGNIKAYDVVKDGFEKDEIGKELRRRKEEEAIKIIETRG